MIENPKVYDSNSCNRFDDHDHFMFNTAIAIKTASVLLDYVYYGKQHLFIQYHAHVPRY